MGQDNDLYVDAQYLKAKSLFAAASSPETGTVDLEKVKESLELLDSAISFHKKNGASGSLKDLQYVMCLMLRGTINKNIMLEEEAVRGYLKAAKLIMDMSSTTKSTTTEVLCGSIVKDIEDAKARYLKRTGEELDTEAIAEESDEEP